MYTRLRLLLVLMLAVLLAGCSNNDSDNQAPYASTIARITSHIESNMAQNNVTGLSIALVDDQTVVWAQGFGYADKEAGVPATADTIFEIGSVSKLFGATAIMRLAEEGRLDIDQPLTTYLPSFSINQRFPAAGPITIRSILTHHSGIPGDLFNGSFTEGAPFDYNTWLLNYLKNEYTSAPVGSVFAYSNSAMALLGPVIDRVAPGGFKAYANGLFDLMGMRTTSFDLDERIPRERLSKGYDEGDPQPLLYGNLSTAGSVRSTVLDMAQFIKTINAGGAAPGGRLVNTSTLDLMFTRQNGNAPLDFDQSIGLAWFLDPPGYYAGRRVNHEGATAWCHSKLQILPDHKLGVIVLSNTMAADVGGIADKALEYALEEKKGIVPPAPPAPPFSPPDTTWTQAQLDALAGTYIRDTGVGMNFDTYTIQAVSGGLLLPGRPDVWIPRQNGYFSLPVTDESARTVQLRFQTVAGRFVMSYLVGGHEYVLAERYDQGVIPAAWAARRGAYTATNVNPGSALWPGTNTIILDIDADGFLRIRGTLRGDIPIKPVSDTLAFIPGIGRNRGESVRAVTADGAEQIEFWGYRYRKD